MAVVGVVGVFGSSGLLLLLLSSFEADNDDDKKSDDCNRNDKNVVGTLTDLNVAFLEECCTEKGVGWNGAILWTNNAWDPRGAKRTTRTARQRSDGVTVAVASLRLIFQQFSITFAIEGWVCFPSQTKMERGLIGRMYDDDDLE